VLDFRPLGETFYPLFRLEFTLIRVAFGADPESRQKEEEGDWNGTSQDMHESVFHDLVRLRNLWKESGHRLAVAGIFGGKLLRNLPLLFHRQAIVGKG